MKLPSPQEIEMLHKKYTPTKELLESVYVHCQIVRDIALQVIANKNLEVDADLVEVGCLLHDIGVYKLFDQNGHKLPDYHYMKHGENGDELLKKEEYPEELRRIAACHIGLGFTQSDITRQNLPLSHACMPSSIEERLVMYADKFHSKTTVPQFNTPTVYKEHVKTFGIEFVNRFDKLVQEFGPVDVVTLSKKYGHKIGTVL